MAVRIQALPVLFYRFSLLPSLPRYTRPHNRTIGRLFSDESFSCWRTGSSLSGQPQRCFTFPEKNFASDPRLRANNKRINTFDENLKKLADEMFDVMYKTDGIGLSAPQVGLNIQLMVFNPSGERGEGEEIVLVNPLVHKASKKTLLFNEGCLSFPGIHADVLRPASVKIDARDVRGARFRVNLSGLPARIFQHEYDHLKGTLFFERMAEDELDGIRSELKALEKKYEDLTGQPSPEKIDNFKPRLQFAGLDST